MEEEYMNWDEIIQAPYDKMDVDPYTRTRVILMNGIENNSVLTSHAIERMTSDPEIKRQMAAIRRADSQQQQTVDWLNPPDQSVLETTIAYEQVAVDLTANLAKNEPDPYVKSTLDFALLEDFDHLYRYGCMMEILRNQDPEQITGGKTEVKPGRPTCMEHRHPDDSMRNHYDKDETELKTKMNYLTITSGEQQTELFYKTHGNTCSDDLARKLYSEIAEIEDIMQSDSIRPLIMFEPNKKYVNKVLEEQIDLVPYNMEFVHLADLPDNWPSFRYEKMVNSSRIPSEDVVKGLDGGLAEKEKEEIYQNLRNEFRDRVSRSTASK